MKNITNKYRCQLPLLSNPKVMQQKTFADEVTASNAKQAAQKLLVS